MSYLTENIARVGKPAKVALSRSSNFLTIRSIEGTETKVAVNIEVKLTKNTQQQEELTKLVLRGADGVDRVFSGVKDKTLLNANRFFVGETTAETAENIRAILLTDEYLRARFDIIIPPITPVPDWVQNGSTIQIRGKESGEDFALFLTAPGNAGSRYYAIKWEQRQADRGDSLIGNAPSAEITLDVYGKPDESKPSDLGNSLVQLKKTYYGHPISFDLGRVFSTFGGYALPPNAYEWSNTGTSTSFRVSASVTTHTTKRFYFSDVLRVLNGRTIENETGDLKDYVCKVNESLAPPTSKIKLLSNKPRCNYVKGQKEYLNFIFLDPARKRKVEDDYHIGVYYRAFSPVGNLLYETFAQSAVRTDFHDVNTLLLDIDSVLTSAHKASLVEVCLRVRDNDLSEPIGFDVRPSCWHRVQQFSFLNRLGGWDAFNFDAEVKEENKVTLETFRRPRQADYKKGDAIEDVHASNIRTYYSIESAPLTCETAKWVKEIAVSPAILDNEGRRVVLDEFALNIDPTNVDMHRLTVKYHLSV